MFSRSGDISLVRGPTEAPQTADGEARDYQDLLCHHQRGPFNARGDHQYSNWRG